VLDELREMGAHVFLPEKAFRSHRIAEHCGAVTNILTRCLSAPMPGEDPDLVAEAGELFGDAGLVNALSARVRFAGCGQGIAMGTEKSNSHRRYASAFPNGQNP